MKRNTMLERDAGERRQVRPTVLVARLPSPFLPPRAPMWIKVRTVNLLYWYGNTDGDSSGDVGASMISSEFRTTFDLSHRPSPLFRTLRW